MRARQRRRADHGVRDRDRRGVPAVLAPSRRRAAARGRARRPARRHQRDRDAARQRRSRRCRSTMWNSSATRIEKIAAEKAAHPQARRAGGDRAADRRRAGGDRAAGASACARRCASPGEDWSVHGEHGRLVYQDDDGLLDLPLPRLAGRHQFDNAGTAIAALRAAGLGAADRGLRGGHRQGRMAGAHAAADAGHAQGADAAGERALARRRPQRRRRPRASRRRSAISRSACRARWC